MNIPNMEKSPNQRESGGMYALGGPFFFHGKSGKMGFQVMIGVARQPRGRVETAGKPISSSQVEW
jgi:hypothetical protein